MSLDDEIREQPDVLARLLERAAAPVGRVADALRERGVGGLHIAARGTSDHAAIYAQYVFGVRHGLPVALAAPSIATLYGAAPRFGDAAVIGISQSGTSPDVVAVVSAGRAQGAPTVAITNDPESPLAEAAEHILDLGAGAERAVAATKTYTSELMVIAMLSQTWAAEPPTALEAVPGAVRVALDADEPAREAAADRASLTTAVVLGRGFEYATAREWSLKIKELARVLADPYSAADFLHGPLALLDPGYPVLAVATSGEVESGMRDLLRRLRDDHAVDTVAISDAPDGLAANAVLPVPTAPAPWLQPIVSAVPAQLFAAHLARARGLDPDAPFHIRKVTRTR